jgi:hypothetical protein
MILFSTKNRTPLSGNTVPKFVLREFSLSLLPSQPEMSLRHNNICDAIHLMRISTIVDLLSEFDTLCFKALPIVHVFNIMFRFSNNKRYQTLVKSKELVSVSYDIGASPRAKLCWDFFKFLYQPKLRKATMEVSFSPWWQTVIGRQFSL